MEGLSGIGDDRDPQTCGVVKVWRLSSGPAVGVPPTIRFIRADDGAESGGGFGRPSSVDTSGIAAPFIGCLARERAGVRGPRGLFGDAQARVRIALSQRSVWLLEEMAGAKTA